MAPGAKGATLNVHKRIQGNSLVRGAPGRMADNTDDSVRIALADDEPDLRTSMARLLTLLGHRVVYSASNGAELLEACSSHAVDLVILDLDRPLMDGLTAAE